MCFEVHKSFVTKLNLSPVLMLLHIAQFTLVTLLKEPCDIYDVGSCSVFSFERVVQLIPMLIECSWSRFCLICFTVTS